MAGTIATSTLMPQLLRFAVAGVGVTLLSATIYMVSTGPVGVEPIVANMLGHACGVLAGFHIHSRWSFRDVGRRDDVARLGRFAAASTAALLLNSLWVWLLATRAGAWAPVPAMLIVTPLASFVINRHWTFARRD